MAPTGVSLPRMGTVIVKIQHIVWRDGRPRFVPGPGLRTLGYEGRDLRHGDTGPWFTLAEAEAESNRLSQEIADRREQKGLKPRKRLPPVPRRPGLYTLAELFKDVEKSPRFGSVRRNAAPLAKVTQAFYRDNAALLVDFDPVIAVSPIAAIRPSHLFALSERLQTAKGVAVMRAVMATLSRALTYAKKLGKIDLNPAHQLQLPMPAPRVRSGSPFEIRTLIAAADAIGHHDVADMLVHGVSTGQRQKDRIGYHFTGYDDAGRLITVQSKRGAMVAIRPTAYLALRLAAAAERRKALLKGKELTQLFIDEARGLPWTKERYNEAWRAVRTAAVAGVTSPEGCVLVPPCASVSDFRDQDLRDTHITWLSNAGGTLAQTRATSGLSLVGITQTLPHYMAIDPEQSDAAIDQLDIYLAAKGF